MCFRSAPGFMNTNPECVFSAIGAAGNIRMQLKELGCGHYNYNE